MHTIDSQLLPVEWCQNFSAQLIGLSIQKFQRPCRTEATTGCGTVNFDRQRHQAQKNFCWWSGGILRDLREPQIEGGNGAEWQWMARQDKLRTLY